MCKKRLVESYSFALFNALPEKDRGDVIRILKLIEDRFYKDRDVVRALLSPVVTSKEKLGLASAVLSDIDVPEVVSSFIHLLMTRSRLALFRDIVGCYDRLLKRIMNIGMAYIVSSKKLDTKQENDIICDLEALIGRKLEANFAVDKSIIGGLVVRYDNYLLDVSIANALATIQKQVRIINLRCYD